MPAGMQASSAIWAAAFLAAPALFPCTQDLVKYNFLRRFHPQIVEATLWSDRSLFLLLSAGAMGIIAVVMWDTLFPSRRDVFALGPLPVESRVQSAGRLGGLLTLFGMFVVALNALPALLFPLVSSGNFVGIFRDLIGHVVTTTAADAFVFFGLTTVQGLLIVATSRRAAERLAPILQTGAVLLLLIGLLFFGPLRGATTRALAEGDLTNPVLRWCPLAWFVGLYETISGTSRPVMHALALRGLLGRYRCARSDDRALRVRVPAAVRPRHRDERTVDLVGALTLVAAVVRRVFVRHPVEQAICGFTLRVLTRSRRHRMLLSIYVGGALALIAAGLLPEIFGTRTGIFRQPTVGTLAAPLIVSAGLAVGFRTLLAIPVDLPARWIFQTLSIPPLRAMSGVHKAGVIVVLLPVVTTAWVSARCSGGRPLPGDTRRSADRSVCFCSNCSCFRIGACRSPGSTSPEARASTCCGRFICQASSSTPIRRPPPSASSFLTVAWPPHVSPFSP